jgi:aspartate-semialdehyde dehydrogenase
MADGMYRIGIVGAGSLVGKELADELQDSLLAASDFILLDDEEVTGQVASVGDEAAFIQRIEPGSFDRMDFVFFAGTADSTRKHWAAARRSGASIVDLTGALEQEKGVLVRAPWVNDALKVKSADAPDLSTPAVVPAHAAAVMLGLVAARVGKVLPIRSLAATVIEPASQHGREAMDELHQQTVNLLSFQTLPREQYDAQVAFNVLPVLGESAKVKLLTTEEQISRHYSTIGGVTLASLDIELVQAPVFHGYVASVLLELDDDATVEDLERALAGDSIDLVSTDSEPPSNLSAAGQEDIMTRVRAAGTSARRFWIWLAADNLKLSALNAIACANELKRLRPRGKVQ